MINQAVFHALPREKKENEKVDMYTRLKGPDAKDGPLTIIQDWNSQSLNTPWRQMQPDTHGTHSF